MCVCIFIYLCLQKVKKYHKIIFNAIKWFYTPLNISSLFQPSYVSLNHTEKGVEMNGFQFCFVLFFNWFTGIFAKVVKESLDREAWHAAVHGVTKSQTRLSDWTELNYIHKWPLIKGYQFYSPQVLFVFLFVLIYLWHINNSKQIMSLPMFENSLSWVFIRISYLILQGAPEL